MAGWLGRIREIGRRLYFLLFLAGPLFVLIVQAAHWEAQAPSLREALAIDPPAAATGSPPTRQAGAGAQGLGGPPATIATATASAAGASPTGNALTKGRFEWMTFHLAVQILYPLIGLIAAFILCANLGRWSIPALGIAGLMAWKTISIMLPRDGGISPQSAPLLLPTKAHALPHYDPAFQAIAWEGMRLDYGFVIVLIFLLPLAGAATLFGTEPGRSLGLQALPASGSISSWSSWPPRSC